MSILLPRARLDLASAQWRFLSLSLQERKYFQGLLDDSELEKRLQGKFNQQLISITTTDILPSEFAINFSSEKLDDFEIIILVSKHAAFLAKVLLPEQSLTDAKCFSVGRSSHRFFDAVPIKSASRENAAGLLALDDLKAIQNLKVLIVKGELGLDVLEKECEKRGARVTVFDFYQRQLASKLKDDLAMLDFASVEGIYGTSVFALRHLLSALSDTQKEQLLEKQLIAMSKRIAEEAKTMGFSRVELES